MHHAIPHEHLLEETPVGIYLRQDNVLKYVNARFCAITGYSREEILGEKAIKAGLRGLTYPSVREAYSSAINNAGTEDMVFVGGSTFVVAEII